MKTLFLILAALLPAGLCAQAPDLRDAAAKALPAVVQIQSFFSNRVWDRHPELVKLGVKASRADGGALIGTASGVLLSADGYLITNAHVLNGGDSLMVILPDRRAYRAALTGIDNAADLALLKISETGLKFLELGDPDLLHIGDPVLAVGNPLELTSTVTAGILSARYRSMDDPLASTLINSYLQTDAASNEGMSGSALVDRSGALIGINSAIISPTGTFAGYAFAIPAGMVKKAWHDLVSYGAVRHAYLDLSFRDMDAGQAKRLGEKNPSGVLIDSLQAGGAGDQAGLRIDDIIIQLDRQNIDTAPQLRELLAQHMPGDQVKLTVKRKLDEIGLSVTLSPGRGAEAAARLYHLETWPVIRTNGHH